jgi:acyl carrier protein
MLKMEGMMANKIEMTQAEVENRLIEILARVTVIDAMKIHADRELRGEILVDSLSEAEFMMEVEEAFDLELANDAYAKAFPGQAMTVRKIAGLVRGV